MHNTVKFWGVICEDLEVEEDAPSSAIRKLKSFHTLLNIPLPAMQESVMLDLTAVTGRNGMRLLGLAIIIWEGNSQISRERRNISFCKQSYKKITISLKLLTNSGIRILEE